MSDFNQINPTTLFLEDKRGNIVQSIDVNTEIDTQLLLQVANTINSLCELIDDDFS